MLNSLFLAGMPWGILGPIFLFGIAMGIFRASRNRSDEQIEAENNPV